MTSSLSSFTLKISILLVIFLVKGIPTGVAELK